ncbi:hypothetical protein ABK040_009567 [Willaertia magna]
MAEQLLMNAANNGDLVQVSTLIAEANADVNFIDVNNKGYTPSHVACENGLVSILELLLSYEGDPNVKCNSDSGGSTPLHIATSKGYKKMVEILLNYFADPNIQDSNGFTPLHISCRKGFVEIAKLLVAKGADVDIGDAQGKTAYYWAKEYKHEELLPFLEAASLSTSNNVQIPTDNVALQKLRNQLGNYDWSEHYQKTKAAISVVKLPPPKTTRPTTTKKKKKPKE